MMTRFGAAAVVPQTARNVPPGTRLVLATRNAKKLVELRRALEAAAPATDIEWDSAVIGADQVESAPDVVEDGTSFAENARKKADALFLHTGVTSLADDSGLAVDVMGGAPGIFSARWAGTAANDATNRKLLLEQLADVPQAHRGAQFTCALALTIADSSVTFTEHMRGEILTEERGDGGFGYDPIFCPDGYDRSCAELSPAEKDSISHRGKALRKATAAILAQL